MHLYAGTHTHRYLWVQKALDSTFLCEFMFSKTLSHCTSQHLFDLLAGLGSGELVNNIQRCLTECVPHSSTDTTLKRKARTHIHMVHSAYTFNTDTHTITYMMNINIIANSQTLPGTKINTRQALNASKSRLCRVNKVQLSKIIYGSNQTHTA